MNDINFNKVEERIHNTVSTVDIAKFFFCCCIILLHTNVLSILPPDVFFYIKKIILRSAVPFFFVTSGYFLGKKIIKTNCVTTCVISYCKRLFFPLVVFTIVNLVELDTIMIMDGKSLMYIFLSNVRAMIFYPPGALWFVWACIVGSITLLPFLIRKRYLVSLVIGLVLYIYALLCNNYYFLIHETSVQYYIDQYLSVFVSPRNGFFLGFFFIAIGVYCSNLIVRPKYLFFCLMVSFVLLVFEVTFLKGKLSADDGSLYLSQLLFVPSLLLSLMRINVRLPYTFSITLRKLSVGMYYLHKPILFVFCILTTSVVFRFLGTFLLALLFCMISYKAKIKPLDKILS